MTGYQQAILYLSGSQLGGRFCVRNVDRHYLDAVAELFPGVSVYLQRREREGKRDFWCVKSSKVVKPRLDEVTDLFGFAQAMIELQSCLTVYVWHGGTRPSTRRRFTIWGAAGDLEFIQPIIPARQRPICPYRTNTGQTYSLAYQSKADIAAILDYFSATPNANAAVWNRWAEKLR